MIGAIMRKIALILSAGLLFSGVVNAGASQKGAAPKKTENSDYYRRWLEEDVIYIISDDEKAVFQKLSTDEERDQFIEQFWLRRNPDPGTPENKYKEEHYLRIQYANENFAAGMPGWKTDRGRIYIQFGKPDRLETHPAGGQYQRKGSEGGGTTSTYPFEVWTYRHIEGVGDDIELEFVNDIGGNMYRLTMDPQDKDELLHVPGMGLTLAEMMDPQFNGQQSFARVNRIRENGLTENQGINYQTAKDNPFEKAVLLMNISKPPAIRFNDLKEKVTARVTYNVLSFRVVTHFLRVDAQTCLVPVTLSFDPHDLSFKTEGGLTRSALQVYGLVTTLGGKTVYEFDDEIAAEYSGRQMDEILQQSQYYQRKLALKPGKFKLDLIVKDTVSGKMGTITVGVDVPPAPTDSLSASSIILARGIERAEPDWSKPYVFGMYKIKPQADRTFADGDDFGFYVEAYNYQLDQSTGKPALTVKYGFAAPGKEPSSYRSVGSGLTMARDRVYLARMVQLQSLEKGKHELVCVITDTLSGQSTSVRAPFDIR
jgi:GWxTD domain-containing protein